VKIKGAVSAIIIPPTSSFWLIKAIRLESAAFVISNNLLYIIMSMEIRGRLLGGAILFAGLRFATGITT
jgi:hypothetical protein